MSILINTELLKNRFAMIAFAVVAAAGNYAHHDNYNTGDML